MDKLKKKTGEVTAQDYNRLVDYINKATNLRGGRGVQLFKSSGGTTINASKKIKAKGMVIHKAYVADDPPTGEKFNANLDEVGGDIVEVNCEIVGGADVNSAVPRLGSGDPIYVISLSGSYHCIDIFQTTKDCQCYTG